jgi:glycosyltransferase involved in cell wall biosynthesis
MATTTVLTVSKRTGWEELALQSLAAQTFRDFQWVVVTERYETLDKLSDTAIVIQAPPKVQPSGLNAATNEGLRYCEGDTVVFYQDFIELQPTHLEALVADVRQTNGLVSTACINHEGKMDGRYTGMDALYEVIYDYWEINLGAAPLKAMYDIGGFDERLDAGWSWDNVLVAAKASRLGYKTYLDEAIQPQLHFHPKETDVNPTIIPNGERCAEILRAIDRGDEEIVTYAKLL